MNKAETIRNERDDKEKLLEDFKYIINSELNMEFKQLFLNRFVDSWINRKNDSYDLNLYWSKKAIEQKIHIERNNQRKKVDLKQAKMQYKSNEIEDIIKMINKHYEELNSKYKYNQDHLVPKVVFEDIFVSIHRVDIGKINSHKFKRRLEQNYVFFKELKDKQFGHIEYKKYLKLFFDEYFTVVTLTKNEHGNLTYSNGMPNEFYKHGNKWSRYKFTKNDEAIEVYEVEFGSLKGITDWEQVSFQSLFQFGYIKSKIDYDGYIPFRY